MPKLYPYDLSHDVLTTMGHGFLVPVCHFEVLPGDSIRMATRALLRAAPLVAPLMHELSFVVNHYFVPYRIIWNPFPDWISGNVAGNAPTTVVEAVGVGNLLNHLGLVSGTYAAAGGLVVSSFPIYAYNKIWNDVYRDDELQAEVNPGSGVLQRVNWEPDRYTRARPYPQEGDQPGIVRVMPPTTEDTAAGYIGRFDVPSLRAGVAVQRNQERHSRYEDTYEGLLQSWGLRPDPVRLDQPEFLGRARARIAFSEVLSSAATTDAGLGEMAGHGISSLSGRPWQKRFREHGIVMSVAYVRPRLVYGQGLERAWLRYTRDDFWNPEGTYLGDQPIKIGELYPTHATPNQVFGYTARYSEYREHLSYVAGFFETTEAGWHFGRWFATPPALNSDFLTCWPDEYPWANPTTDLNFHAQFSHSIRANRIVKPAGHAFSLGGTL